MEEMEDKIRKILKNNPHAIDIKVFGKTHVIILRNSYVEIKEGNMVGFLKECPDFLDGKFSFPISEIEEVEGKNYFLY